MLRSNWFEILPLDPKPEKNFRYKRKFQREIGQVEDLNILDTESEHSTTSEHQSFEEDI